MDTLFSRTSVTVDEAVANLLGTANGPIEFCSLNDDPSEEEEDLLNSLTFDLREDLEEQRDSLQSDYLEAKHDGLADEEIAKRFEALERCNEMIARANTYLCDINGELAKGKFSALQLDPEFAGSSDRYITVSSLAQWAADKYGISLLSPVASSKIERELQAPQPTREQPWLIARPDDPSPEQPWYVAARYFAREFVKEEPTLVGKRNLLASKVATALKDVGINKRGGIKPLDPGTILKAFSKIKFG
jgi:hypothetical protein